MLLPGQREHPCLAAGRPGGRAASWWPGHGAVVKSWQLVGGPPQPEVTARDDQEYEEQRPSNSQPGASATELL